MNLKANTNSMSMELQNTSGLWEKKNDNKNKE